MDTTGCFLGGGFDYRKPPYCYAGDDMQMTYGLADLSKDELYQAIQMRAAMWDLMNFVMRTGEEHNFSSWDDLISFASEMLRAWEEAEAFRESYEGRKQEYNALRYQLKKAMIKRGDKLECRHCGSTKHISIDHIHPLVRGGSNDISNLQFLCRSCNSKKSDST